MKPTQTDPRMTVEELRHELKLDAESDLRFPWGTEASVPLQEVVAWLQGFHGERGVTAIRARFLSVRLILRMTSTDYRGVK